MSRTSRWLSVLVFLFATRAFALPTGIYVTDKQVDTTSPTFEKELKKGRKMSLPSDGGKWHLYFVAYLNKPAPAEQLNIVFYDAKAKGKQEPVAYQFSTKKGARIVVADITCSTEDSLKPGPFDLKITSLVNGKEQVLANSKFELK